MISFKVPQESKLSSQRMTEDSRGKDRYNSSFMVDSELRKGKVSQKIIHTIKNSESPLRTIGRDKENELSLKPLLTKKQTASLNRKSTVRSTF